MVARLRLPKWFPFHLPPSYKDAIAIQPTILVEFDQSINTELYFPRSLKNLTDFLDELVSGTKFELFRTSRPWKRTKWYPVLRSVVWCVTFPCLKLIQKLEKIEDQSLHFNFANSGKSRS